jgi:hypothetical protein
VPNGCKQTNNLTVIGDAYFHEINRVIVCYVTTTPIAANPSSLSANAIINGFYSQWYRLTDNERYINALATYHSTSKSEVINYSTATKFPLLVPRTTFSSIPYFEMTPYLGTIAGQNIACQSDDY